jgi:ParB family protein of integrating conjugative element (PFGI_1 class)
MSELRSVALDERSRRVSESLSVGNPARQAIELPRLTDPGAECQIELGIDEIRAYEHNPRRGANSRFEDIKESIRAGGLRSPLTVTRRPGESHFIVEAGGNTRLLALRQLWAETRDPRFGRLLVLYRPWRSETHVLTAHLIENEQRGDMSFWDRATGVVALKARLEAEQGRVLALRPLEDALHGLGLAVNSATLALYLFATGRLRVLGEAVPDLTGLDVKTLQPRLNALRRHAQARADLEEAAVYAEVFEPVFRSVAGSFSVAATVEACEVVLADRLGESVEALRAALRRDGGRAAQGTGEGGVTPPPRPAASVTPTLAPDETPAYPDVGPDALASGVAAFARGTGVDAALEPAPESPSGYRLRPLPAAQRADPQMRRAWSALALVSEPCPEGAADDVALPTSVELVRWLTDPGDATAAAFWTLLGRLRESRAQARREVP